MADRVLPAIPRCVTRSTGWRKRAAASSRPCIAQSYQYHTTATRQKPTLEHISAAQLDPIDLPAAQVPANIPISRRDAIREAKPFSEFLTDNFARQHDYLRISVTERCNLRCLYCMPEEGITLSPPSHILTTPEIVYLSSLFVSQGVNKIRLTGGEPTVRRDIVPLMQSIGNLRSKGLKELAITTNGISLVRKLDAMAEAGLTGVNLSLDTLDPFQFQIMTRRKGYDQVMKSVDRILEMKKLGAPIKLKINCVAMRGLNHREILPFVEMTREKDIEVRFIEYMPFGGNKWSEGKMLPYAEMLEIIRAKYPELRRVEGHKNDTAKTYEVPGFVGRVGFITSMTNDFCGTCNRLRITSDGNLKVCLHGNTEVSLRDLLREGNKGQPIDEIAYERLKQQEMTRQINGTALDDRTTLGWGPRERSLLSLIGSAVKRKKEKHAGIGELELMDNRPMILIGDRNRSTLPPPSNNLGKSFHFLTRRLTPSVPLHLLGPAASINTSFGGVRHLFTDRLVARLSEQAITHETTRPALVKPGFTPPSRAGKASSNGMPVPSTLRPNVPVSDSRKLSALPQHERSRDLRFHIDPTKSSEDPLAPLLDLMEFRRGTPVLRRRLIDRSISGGVEELRDVRAIMYDHIYRYGPDSSHRWMVADYGTVEDAWYVQHVVQKVEKVLGVVQYERNSIKARVDLIASPAANPRRQGQSLDAVLDNLVSYRERDRGMSVSRAQLLERYMNLIDKQLTNVDRFILDHVFVGSGDLMVRPGSWTFSRRDLSILNRGRGAIDNDYNAVRGEVRELTTGINRRYLVAGASAMNLPTIKNMTYQKPVKTDDRSSRVTTRSPASMDYLSSRTQSIIDETLRISNAALESECAILEAMLAAGSAGTAHPSPSRDGTLTNSPSQNSKARTIIRRVKQGTHNLTPGLMGSSRTAVAKGAAEYSTYSIRGFTTTAGRHGEVRADSSSVPTNRIDDPAVKEGDGLSRPAEQTPSERVDMLAAQEDTTSASKPSSRAECLEDDPISVVQQQQAEAPFNTVASVGLSCSQESRETISDANDPSDHVNEQALVVGDANDLEDILEQNTLANNDVDNFVTDPPSKLIISINGPAMTSRQRPLRSLRMCAELLSPLRSPSFRFRRSQLTSEAESYIVEQLSNFREKVLSAVTNQPETKIDLRERGVLSEFQTLLAALETKHNFRFKNLRSLGHDPVSAPNRLLITITGPGLEDIRVGEIDQVKADFWRTMKDVMTCEYLGVPAMQTMKFQAILDIQKAIFMQYHVVVESHEFDWTKATEQLSTELTALVEESLDQTPADGFPLTSSPEPLQTVQGEADDYTNSVIDVTANQDTDFSEETSASVLESTASVNIEEPSLGSIMSEASDLLAEVQTPNQHALDYAPDLEIYVHIGRKCRRGQYRTKSITTDMAEKLLSGPLNTGLVIVENDSQRCPPEATSKLYTVLQEFRQQFHEAAHRPTEALSNLRQLGVVENLHTLLCSVELDFLGQLHVHSIGLSTAEIDTDIVDQNQICLTGPGLRGLSDVTKSLIKDDFARLALTWTTKMRLGQRTQRDAISKIHNVQRGIYILFGVVVESQQFSWTHASILRQQIDQATQSSLSKADPGAGVLPGQFKFSEDTRQMLIGQWTSRSGGSYASAVKQDLYQHRAVPTPQRSGLRQPEVDVLSSTPAEQPSLTHITATGSVHMVHVGNKQPTQRTAVAWSTVSFSEQATVGLIQSSQLKKGDVLSVARIAGIMAAKKTSEVIPLCHPIGLTGVEVNLDVKPGIGKGRISIYARASTFGVTGVEMEAMHAVSAAALTVYDMVKSVDKHTFIGPTSLLYKDGGRSGTFLYKGYKSACSRNGQDLYGSFKGLRELLSPEQKSALDEQHPIVTPEIADEIGKRTATMKPAAEIKHAVTNKPAAVVKPTTLIGFAPSAEPAVFFDPATMLEPTTELGDSHRSKNSNIEATTNSTKDLSKKQSPLSEAKDFIEDEIPDWAETPAWDLGLETPYEHTEIVTEEDSRYDLEQAKLVEPTEEQEQSDSSPGDRDLQQAESVEQTDAQDHSDSSSEIKIRRLKLGVNLSNSYERFLKSQKR